MSVNMNKITNVEPSLEDETADITDNTESLGSCGCTDYHMADCPTRTGGSESYYYEDYDEFYEQMGY